jgi:hypothetical protein
VRTFNERKVGPSKENIHQKSGLVLTSGFLLAFFRTTNDCLFWFVKKNNRKAFNRESRLKRKVHTCKCTTYIIYHTSKNLKEQFQSLDLTSKGSLSQKYELSRIVEHSGILNKIKRKVHTYKCTTYIIYHTSKNLKEQFQSLDLTSKGSLSQKYVLSRIVEHNGILCK